MDNSVVRIKRKNGNAIIIDVSQAAHGFTVGQVLYFSKPASGVFGQYKLANASQLETANAIGLVYEVVDANNFKLITDGILNSSVFKNYFVGDVIYLGKTDGATTNISLTYSKPIGVKTRSGLLVNIQRGWINLSADINDPDTNGFINSSSSSSFELIVNQTAHGLSAGDVVYCSDAGYKKAIANESPSVEAVGVVSKIIDIDNFRVSTGGLLKTNLFNQYSTGTVLFLSEATEGALTDAEGYVSKPIAIKVNNGIIIDIQRGVIYSLTEDEYDDIPVGTIITTLSLNPQQFYLHMDGRECVIADYPELASYMYNTYGSYTQFGGNGTTTFGLPNLNISVTDANNNVIQMYHYIKYR
jgi:hypothetical protein